MIDEKKLIADMEKLPFIHGRYDKKNANSHFINGTESMYEMIKELIERQPQIGEWIPCSERLPEKTSSYLVTTIAADAFGKPYYVMDVALYNIVYGWTLNNKKCEEIFAWRPLPEPWEGEAAAES